MYVRTACQIRILVWGVRPRCTCKDNDSWWDALNYWDDRPNVICMYSYLSLWLTHFSRRLHFFYLIWQYDMTVVLRFFNSATFLLFGYSTCCQTRKQSLLFWHTLCSGVDVITFLYSVKKDTIKTHERHHSSWWHHRNFASILPIQALCYIRKTIIDSSRDNESICYYLSYHNLNYFRCNFYFMYDIACTKSRQ